MGCKHRYINTNDGTRDKYCYICDKNAKQGVLYFESNTNTSQPSSLSNGSDRVIFGVNTSEAIQGSQLERALRGIAKGINRQLNNKGGRYE